MLMTPAAARRGVFTEGKSSAVPVVIWVICLEQAGCLFPLAAGRRSLAEAQQCAAQLAGVLGTSQWSHETYGSVVEGRGGPGAYPGERWVMAVPGARCLIYPIVVDVPELWTGVVPADVKSVPPPAIGVSVPTIGDTPAGTDLGLLTDPPGSRPGPPARALGGPSAYRRASDWRASSVLPT